MAKQIKRFGPFVVLIAVLTAFIVVPFAKPQQAPPPSPEGNPEIASSIREAIGFGAHDILPAVAGNANHQEMIQAALSYAGENDSNMAQLVEDYRNAQLEVVNKVSWGEDTEQAYQDLLNARTAIVQAGTGLLSELEADVPGDNQGMIGMVQNNLSLDSDLRFLNVGDDQRAAILAAQKERDLVLKDARNWHNRVKNEQARAEFEEALASVLNPQQENALASMRQLRQDRLLEMVQAEAAPFDNP